MINEAEIEGSNIIEIDKCLFKVCKSICKIRIPNKVGTGFLIKLYKENKPFYCLMTNEHVINKETIEQKTKIIVYYDNEFKRIEIELNKNERFIRDYQYMDIDATIVEILEKDNINEEYFLLPDIEYINGYDQYIHKEIYIPQFPEGGNLSSSKGKIETIISNNLFSHKASTKSGSSGSPIFIKGTIRVIGIHRAGKKDKTVNIGHFIGPIIESLKNNLEYKKVEINKDVYEGEFKDNKREGYGKLIYEDGEYYIGEWLNDKKHGNGIEYYKNGNIKYDGNFVDNKFEGKGKFINENGEYYIGEWLNNNPHGKGKLYYKNGSIKYAGEFVDGESKGNCIIY